jgi:hypothetical protein
VEEFVDVKAHCENSLELRVQDVKAGCENMSGTI